MSARRIPPLAMTYLVYWPRYGVMKAGRAWKMSRVRGLVAAGAEVILLVRDTPASWERGGLEALREGFERRFESSIDASRLLPHDGSGWTECFWVLGDELPAAVAAFIEGTTRYADDQETVRDARGDGRRGSRRTVGGDTVPRGRAAHVGGRRGPRTAEFRELEGRGVCERRRDDAGVPAVGRDRARADRVHEVVGSGRREAVLPDRSPVPHGAGETETVGAARPTPRAVRIGSGCRPGRGERARGSRGRGAARTRPAPDVLSRPHALRKPRGTLREVQGLSHGPRGSSQRTTRTTQGERQ